MKWIFTIIFFLITSNVFSQYWSDKGNYKQLTVPGNILKITSNNSNDSIFVSTSACLRIFDELIDKFIFQYNGIHFLNPNLKGFVDIYEDYGYKVNRYRGYSFIEDSFVVQQYFSYWQEYHGDGSLEYNNIYPILKTSTNSIDFVYSERMSVYQSDYSSNTGSRNIIKFSNNDEFRYYYASSYEKVNSSFSSKDIERESKYFKDNINNKTFSLYSEFRHYESKNNEGDIVKSDTSGIDFKIVRFIENDYALLKYERFIYIFDLNKFQMVDTLKVDFQVSGMGMHDGNILFTSDKNIYYYDFNENAITKHLETENNLNSSIFLNIENTILLGSLNKLIKFELDDMDSVYITSIISKDKDESNNNILIFPNPASDYVEISINQPSEDSEIAIYDVLGEKVISESIHPMTQRHRMNVANLPKGVYYVRIGAVVEKFVKM